METKKEDKNLNPYFNEDKEDRRSRRRNVYCIFHFELRYSLIEKALVNKNGLTPKFHYIQIPVSSPQRNPHYVFIFKMPEN